MTRFIEAYDCPISLVFAVYQALLKAHQNEPRVLVRQALDILTPVLAKRFPSEKGKMPEWIRRTKRIVSEDGNALPQLVLIWQLLVRHPDVFYEYREYFVPQIVRCPTFILLFLF